MSADPSFWGSPPPIGRPIRPPDPSITSTTLRYMRAGSAEACRRIVQLAFRDAHSALDLTYAAGCFWRDPLPPGLTITSNNLDPSSSTDLHVDFTATGLATASYDLVVYDPPHLADLGADSIMRRRFGSADGSSGLDALVRAGVAEAWRVARVGILVKLVDSSHGGKFLQLSRWVADRLGTDPYFVAHTFRPPLISRRWRVQRVPRSNGATYLVWRHGRAGHVDFDALYRRQALRLGGEDLTVNLCHSCNARLVGRADRLTCSSACRQRAYRQRGRQTAEARS